MKTLALRNKRKINKEADQRKQNEHQNKDKIKQILEKTTLQTASTISKVTVTFNKSEHGHYSSVLVNWTEAEVVCQRLHPEAHLVAIETGEEQEFLAAKWKEERG